MSVTKVDSFCHGRRKVHEHILVIWAVKSLHRLTQKKGSNVADSRWCSRLLTPCDALTKCDLWSKRIGRTSFGVSSLSECNQSKQFLPRKMENKISRQGTLREPEIVKASRRQLWMVQLQFCTTMPKRIYNSHYGNGVPTMFMVVIICKIKVKPA